MKNATLYSMFHSVYFKDNYPNKVLANKAILDPSVYLINPESEYWQEKGKSANFGWGVLEEYEQFHGGAYRIGAGNNSFFDDMEHNILRIWFLLNLLLSYPALSSNKTVRGKTGVHMNKDRILFFSNEQPPTHLALLVLSAMVFASMVDPSLLSSHIVRLTQMVGSSCFRE